MLVLVESPVDDSRIVLILLLEILKIVWEYRGDRSKLCARVDVSSGNLSEASIEWVC